MQGFLPDNEPFMVSGLPSTQFFSEATVEEPEDGAEQCLPPKAAEALGLLLRAYRERSGVEDGLTGRRVRLFSNIPPGKGLSSSSTDVLSVLDAVNRYWKKAFSKEELYALAVRVEPTDPCLSKGVLVFRQQSGREEETIHLPPMQLVYFDAAPDSLVDTLLVKRPPLHQAQYRRLLEQFIAAAVAADYPGLFSSVTESAVYNQEVMTIPAFASFKSLAAELKAGIVIAHSGTMVGFLVRPGEEEECRNRLVRIINYPATIYTESYV